MSGSEKLEISYGAVKEKFRNHLRLKHNKYILFSGRYGTGKSTFLEQFFDVEKEYYAITISPVDYVVSSNENIFELIKVDIIKQLYLDGHLNFQEMVEASYAKRWGGFALARPLQFVKHLATALSKLHPVMERTSNVSKSVIELITDFSKFEKEYIQKIKAEGKNEEQQLLDHWSEFSEQAGTYLEYDIISRMLKDTLSSIHKGDQEKGVKKKATVLVIDDLDRLDPEHIFRILNIFSAHNDHLSGGHKFGFDKVVLVADIQNIEVLFRHRYGDKSDFRGYMDKFYSDQIFNFTNEILAEIVRSKLKMNLPDRVLNFLRLFIAEFIEAGELTIRNLIKSSNWSASKNFLIEELVLDRNTKYTIYTPWIKGNTLTVNSTDFPEIQVVSIMASLFGDRNQFLAATKRAFSKGTSPAEELLEAFLNCFVPVLHFAKYQGTSEGDLFEELWAYMYLREQEDFRYQGGIPAGSFVADYPIGEIFKVVKYRILLDWNRGNPYDGGSSFFSNCQVDWEWKDAGDVEGGNYYDQIDIFEGISILNRYLSQFNKLGELGVYN